MYIAIEGIDGAGKGTQIKLLVDRLLKLGFKLTVFREPGGTAAGEQLRSMLLDKSLDLNSESQLLMFAAARFQLLQTVEQEEAKGNIVISDRCVATSYAYQGHAFGLGFDSVDRKHFGLRLPDRVLVLDIAVETAVERRRTCVDRFSSLGLQFMYKASEGYRKFVELHPARAQLVSAEGTPDEVFARVWAVLQPTIDPALGEFNSANRGLVLPEQTP